MELWGEETKKLKVLMLVSQYIAKPIFELDIILLLHFSFVLSKGQIILCTLSLFIESKE